VQNRSSGRDIIAAGNHAERLFFYFFLERRRSSKKTRPDRDTGRFRRQGRSIRGQPGRFPASRTGGADPSRSWPIQAGAGRSGRRAGGAIDTTGPGRAGGRRRSKQAGGGGAIRADRSDHEQKNRCLADVGRRDGAWTARTASSCRQSRTRQRRGDPRGRTTAIRAKERGAIRAFRGHGRSPCREEARTRQTNPPRDQTAGRRDRGKAAAAGVEGRRPELRTSCASKKISPKPGL
jgi:hypothetical protein